MTELPLPIQALVLALKSLPGIGPRSAERMALHVIQMEPERVRVLSEALMFARERIVACDRCGGLTECQPCRICSDGQRDAGMLCVSYNPFNTPICVAPNEPPPLNASILQTVFV